MHESKKTTWETLSRKEQKQLQAHEAELAAQLEREYHAELGLRSFWHFANTILRIPVLYEPLHRMICDWIQNEQDKRKKLLLMARGHVKSNLGTIAWPLWKLCRYQSERILLDSHKDPDAVKFNRAIQNIIENHDNFRAHYPFIIPATEGRRKARWNKHETRIVRDDTLVENNIEITSIDQEVTGRHYSILVSDDLVTRQNVRSSDQILKTRDHHELNESLLDPGALELMIGTRYAHDDEYGRILGDHKLREEWDILEVPAHNNKDVFEKICRGIIKWKPEHDERYLAFPSRFTLDKKDYNHPTDPAKSKKSLVMLKNAQGSTNFANQYELDPYDTSDLPFQANDLKVVTKYRPGPLEFYRFLDMSSAERTKDSRTALVTIATDKYCDVYICDIWVQNADPIDIAKEIMNGYEHPASINALAPIQFLSHEPGPYERSLIPVLNRMCNEKGIWVPQRKLSGSVARQAKDQRIMGLQPWVENHKIKILNSCRNKEELIDEITKYPKNQFKDIIDALSQFPHQIFQYDEGAFLRRPPEDSDIVAPQYSHETFNEHLRRRGLERNALGNERVSKIRIGRW